MHRYKKGIAIELRLRGKSYNEISEALFIPKSTLSYWLKSLDLTPEQKEKLKKRQLEAIKKGSQKKSIRRAEFIEQIKTKSSREIGRISKRELWLLGVMLYWRENFNKNYKKDVILQKGVYFSNSNPTLIKFFLKWLQEIGGIQDEEIAFDIFATPRDKKYAGNKKDKKNEENGEEINLVDQLIKRWATVTEFPKRSFTHIYYLKAKRRKSKRNIRSKSEHSFLRIRVRSSSMLARQISGWIKGMKDQYWPKEEKQQAIPKITKV